jgi:hypothetical protein
MPDFLQGERSCEDANRRQKRNTRGTKQVITSLAIGASVLAFSLTTSLQAQGQKAPVVGTFYSAKDPDLAPLPFNPHPELRGPG